MTNEEFQAALRANGVRNGYWAHHPRPWSLVARGVETHDGTHLRAVKDAVGAVVLTDYGVGLDRFWEAYLRTVEGES